jgi:hypothetical protein
VPLEPSATVPGRIAACARVEALLLAIADLRLDTPAVHEALRRLQHRFARHDHDLVRCLRVVAHELREGPQKPDPRRGFLP